MTREPAQVVSIAAMNEWGQPLFGLRRSSGKWTMPGGYINKGESIPKAAVRELYEETGLRPDELTYLGKETITISGRPVTVHAFRARVSGTPTCDKDPDQECSEWRFVDARFHELPAEIANNLHNPVNVALDFLGYQDWRGPSAHRQVDHHFWSPKPKDADYVHIHPDTVMDEAMYRPRRSPNKN